LKISIFILTIIALSSGICISQIDVHNNNIEIKLSTFDVTRSGSKTYRNYFGNSVALKYKRSIYKDKRHNLALGLLYQNQKAFYLWQNFKEGHDYYGFSLNQTIHSAGLSFSNRITFTISNIGLFLEPNINLVHGFRLKQLSSFSDVQEESWGIGCCSPLAIENELQLNPMLLSIGINGGFEFNEPKIMSIYIAAGLNQTINSIFQDTLVSSLIPKHPPLYFFSPSFSIGTRF